MPFALLHDVVNLIGFCLGLNAMVTLFFQAVSVAMLMVYFARAFGLPWSQTPGGNQVDGFGSVIDQDLPALPILEIVIKLDPTLSSVSYVMIQTATAFIAAAGVGLSIIGHACSSHPWMTLCLMTILYTLGALTA